MLALGPRKQIIIQSCLSSGSASVLQQGLHKTIMRPLPRLESEPESGAISGQLFISAALIQQPGVTLLPVCFWFIDLPGLRAFIQIVAQCSLFMLFCLVDFIFDNLKR
jgi:hypothetical protein